MVKILIKREVKKNDYPKLLGYLKDLRAAALRHPGYVSGETLIRGEKAVKVLVISTWLTENNWKAWSTAPVRIEIDDMITPLLVSDPVVESYKVPADLEE